MRTPGVLFLGVALALAACGGGGGGGGGSGPQAPAAPLNLVAVVNGTDVDLTWAASASATEYEIYGDSQPGVIASVGNFVGSVTVTNASISGLPVGVPLFFAVSAKNATGEGSLSSEVFVKLIVSGVDPLFVDQWHLVNAGQAGGTSGEDVHIANVWLAGFSGAGVRIAVVDDGLEIAHEDLASNVVFGKSHNYVDGSTNPTSGAHGTCCAGVAASVFDNSLGGVGAAFGAELVGYNLLQNLTDTNIADAMTRNKAEIWISTNSWGGADGLGVPQPNTASWRNAVDAGLASGRNGLGTIYLWAAGNGADQAGGVTDNSNLDGLTNYNGVIAVGAVGDDGVKASYSENGANLMICAPSQGNNPHAITTVDRTGSIGFNTGANPNDYPNTNYTNTFNGTSSATPLAAGVVATMLEINPALTHRDVRLILAMSARQNDPSDQDWATNGAGLLINHKYGFGVIDAQAAGTLAQTWVNIGTQKHVFSTLRTPNLAIPDFDTTGVTDTVSVVGSLITKIEYVQIFFDADDHTSSGDLEVLLTAPSGTVSLLAEPHNQPSGPQPYNDFTFGSTRHMEEPADGVWSVRVRDLLANDTGTFKSWRLEFYGR